MSLTLSSLNQALPKCGLDWKMEWKTMENGTGNGKVISNPYIVNEWFILFFIKIHFLSLLLLQGKFNNVWLQLKYICYWCWTEINTHFDVILCTLCVNFHCWAFPALCKHYKCVHNKEQLWGILQTDINGVILLQSCLENLYYFERHVTVKYSTNPFSIPHVPFFVPFSGPVCCLNAFWKPTYSNKPTEWTNISIIFA